ncbi:MAG: serine/threonine protein kinase, partial [Myxococcales bacterium]|nr:serine/threonine protein kinase [Myxococcales bacterium]
QLRQHLAVALGDAYKLGPEIGRGGMGVVYLATDTRLRREVAIKVLPPELSLREDLRERFVFEAQLAAGLNHPHIVPIFDVGEHEGLVWYVMAYVEGESARGRVQREGPFTSAQTRRILREVAWALAYAHARGIVHRDIKPDNIMIERASGRALVTDFGIAMRTETDTPGKGTDLVVGSLMYMAPEQASGTSDIDGRADLYALGLSGYYLLTGQSPFPRSTILSVAGRIATGLTPAWDDVEPPIDPPLRDLLERCALPSPEDRWEDAEKLLETLGPQALAPRPMPASIRRLVRDFMLVPTLGFIILLVDFLSEDPSLSQFIGWMAVILSVNFLVTLRAFLKRGYRWPDLREGLDMEVTRQAEELEATGALKQRFSAIVHFATWAGVFSGLMTGVVAMDLSPVWLWAFPALALAGVLQYPLAWIQIKVASFFGRLALRLLPSMPRPESEGWFSRFTDKLLTKLFQPLPWGKAKSITRTQPTKGWTMPEIGKARRSTNTIDELVEALPTAARDEARPARLLARELTSAIDTLRKERRDIERLREREIEGLNATSRTAAVILDNLRDALERVGDTGDANKLQTAITKGERLLQRANPEAEGRPEDTKRKRLTRNWLGVKLDTAVSGSSPYDEDDTAIRQLAKDVTAQWDTRTDLHENLPHGADQVAGLLRRVSMLESSMFLNAQRDAETDPRAKESLTACEDLLAHLAAALHAEPTGNVTAEIEGLLRRVEEMQGRIDHVLAPNEP